MMNEKMHCGYCGELFSSKELERTTIKIIPLIDMKDEWWKTHKLEERTNIFCGGCIKTNQEKVEKWNKNHLVKG